MARRWSKQRRAYVMNTIFFVVMVSLIFVIGWWAILIAFVTAILIGSLLPRRSV